MTAVYGTGLPTGAPQTGRENATFRLSSYKRVDIGFSAKLLQQKFQKKSTNTRNLWINLEIYNILGVNNTVSYLWLTVVPSNINPDFNASSQYAIPNRLSSRRINLKLIFSF